MLLVHIGMGKTATTSLQKSVFPKLRTLVPDLVYNDPRVVHLCRKLSFFHLTEAERQELSQTVKAPQQALLSMEGLIGTNPRQWENAANENLALFGPDAHILITVRDPVSYLTSIYQQKVHEGNVKTPQEFFLSSEDYDRLKLPECGWKFDHCDVGRFDLQHLHELYKERFDNVHFVPMSKIRDFAFLRDTFGISKEAVGTLQNAFDNSPRQNVAYSALAMKLTFGRERLLRAVGAKTIGSNDMSLIEYYQKNFADGRLVARVRHKTNHLPARAYRKLSHRLGHVLKWRTWMQGGVNKFLPYRKYKLPELEAMDVDLMARNRAYLRQFE